MTCTPGPNDMMLGASGVSGLGFGQARTFIGTGVGRLLGTGLWRRACLAMAAPLAT